MLTARRLECITSDIQWHITEHSTYHTDVICYEFESSWPEWTTVRQSLTYVPVQGSKAKKKNHNGLILRIAHVC